MSVWMEFRCNTSHEDCAEPNGLFGDDRSECWSHHNSGPMEMANATQRGIIITYKHMCEDAKKAGWKKIDGEWVCPHCYSNLSKEQDNA